MTEEDWKIVLEKDWNRDTLLAYSDFLEERGEDITAWVYREMAEKDHRPSKVTRAMPDRDAWCWFLSRNQGILGWSLCGLERQATAEKTLDKRSYLSREIFNYFTTVVFIVGVSFASKELAYQGLVKALSEYRSQHEK